MSKLLISKKWKNIILFFSALMIINYVGAQHHCGLDLKNHTNKKLFQQNRSVSNMTNCPIDFMACDQLTDGYCGDINNECTLPSGVCGNENYRVPISIKCFAQLDLAGNIVSFADPLKIDEDISELNNLFSDAKIEFYEVEPKELIPNNDLFSFNICDDGSFPEDDFCTLGSFDTPEVLNIYYTGQILDCNGNSNDVRGVASLPGNDNHVIIGQDFAGADWRVLTHEVGHFFGLIHTWSLDPNPNVTPPIVAETASNCCDDFVFNSPSSIITGDFICETVPWLNSLNSNISIDPSTNLCIYDNSNTQYTQYFDDYIDNIMSFMPSNQNNLDCREEFVSCQYVKMNEVLLSCRNTLCGPQDIADYIVSGTDIFGNTTICQGEPAPTFFAVDDCFEWFNSQNGSITSFVIDSDGMFTPTINTNIPGVHEFFLRDERKAYNPDCGFVITLTILPFADTNCTTCNNGVQDGDEGGIDCDGSCPPCEVMGCTDATATNFNPMATVDDGSCTFAPIMGCTDATATNFDPMATVDDGSCTFAPIMGCTDATATNFNPLATVDDGSCTFLLVFGCTDATATNFNPLATVDDGSCTFAPVMGCTDASATNFDPMATVDDGSCTFEGCTDPAADNFDPNANSDDGSCIYLGCTNPLATNFDPNANSDDGSCEFCEIINTPIDIQEDTDPGLASTTVNWSGPNLTSGCLASVLICDSNPGDSFGIGTTKVTCTVTAPNSEIITTCFNVIVADNEPPMLTGPSNVNVCNEPNTCYGLVPDLSLVVNSSDNSGSSIVSQSIPVGTQFGENHGDQIDVVVTAIDASGNSTTITITITLEDCDPPTFINCPIAPFTFGLDPTACTAFGNWSIPVAGDNCTVTVTQTAGPVSGDALTLDMSPYTVEFTATDEAGNTAICTFDVIVEDTQDLEFQNCPDDYVFGLDPDQCMALTNWSIPVATDNCEVTVTQIAGPTPGTPLALGTYTITYQAVNNATPPDMVECTFDVIVEDTQDLEFQNCPTDLFFTTEVDECVAYPIWSQPIATDNCDVTVTQIAGPIASEALAPGTYTVTYEAVNNATPPDMITCTFDVTVEDNQEPNAICKDIEVELDLTGTYIVPFSEVDGGSVDNCEIETITIDGGASVTFTCDDIGQNWVTLEVTDIYGNVASCDAEVTVLNNLTDYELALDVPELCIEDNNIEQLTFPHYLTITNDAGVDLDPENLPMQYTGTWSIVAIDGTGSAGSIDPVTGVYTPGTGTGFVTVRYTLTQGMDACFMIVEDIFELRQPLDIGIPFCECDLPFPQESYRKVVLGTVTGGLEPYTIQFEGGGLDLDSDGIADVILNNGTYVYDIANGHIDDDFMQELGEIVINDGETNWSFTIVDARGCEIARQGQCDPLLNVPDWIGANSPACFTDGTYDLSLNNDFDITAAYLDGDRDNGDLFITKLRNSLLADNKCENHPGFNADIDFTDVFVRDIIEDRITVNPENLIGDDYRYAGTYRITMLIPADINTECLQVLVEEEITIYPSFDACFDLPLEACGNGEPVRIDVNEYNPGYDLLADDLLCRDLDEMSVWELILPSGTVVGVGTTGQLFQEGEMAANGAIVLEGLEDGDVIFDPSQLLDLYGPGQYTLNHEMGIDICKTSCTVPFTVLDFPKVSTSTTMPVVCCGDDITLVVDSIYGGTQIYQYQWTEMSTGYQSSTVSFPTIPVFQDTLLPMDTLVFPVSALPGGCPAQGVYEFVLTVTDSKGCQNRDIVEIAINPSPSLAPEVVNAIYCQTNPFLGASPVKNIAYSTSVLTVNCGVDNDGDGSIDSGACANLAIIGDRDGDGIPDEADADLNGPDADGDGIPDSADVDIQGSDADSDGIPDITDMDVLTTNMDTDGDGIPDASDTSNTAGFPDTDGDCIIDECDADVNSDGVNDNGVDTDGIVNACDAGGFDTDGDGILDAIDADIQGNDTDSDGITDSADADVDGDGIPNAADADFTGADNDADGINDAGDVDDDNDGVFDSADHNPTFAFDHTDLDNDEINNAADVDVTGGVDANGDGIDDTFAALSLNDSNGDGIDDTVFLQDDNNQDGIIDGIINPNDADSDDILDSCDTDADNDGINDACDIDQNPGAGDADGDGIIDACDTLVYPSPTSRWFASETSDEPLFDSDSDKDGVNDEDLDGDDATFDPVHAGLVDPNVPGEYTFWVECYCLPDNKCVSQRVPVTITILDCQADAGDCTYLLVLQDFGGDGWEGASIDVLVDELPPAENYKLTNEDCDLRIIPITTGDGGSIDLTYWGASKENEHGWFVAAPDGTIANDNTGTPAFYNAFPPQNQKITVKLDCPVNCEDTQDYYIVNTIGDAAANQLWELRDAAGALVAFNSFEDYAGLPSSTMVIDTVQLSTCSDFTFTIFDPNGTVWQNASWQILGSDADRGVALPNGLFEIISGPNGNFVDEQNCAFNIPCKPEECPEDELVLTTNTTDCELASFVHPNLPEPFICYPTVHHGAPAPTITISYPDLGLNNLPTGTGVDLPVGVNPVVFEITYKDGQVVRCSSDVKVITDSNPIFACNDHLNIPLGEVGLTTTDDCFRIVTPDELIESPLACEDQYSVIIFDLQGQRLSPPNVVGPNQVGQVLTYKVEHIGSEVSCWGTLTVEDKIAPEIACTDYTIECTHPDLLDENFSHLESYAAIDLPANISGALGSSVSTTIDVGCAPLGEVVLNVELAVNHAHSRPSDLSVTITSPSGISVTTGVPANQNAVSDAYSGQTFESLSGTWDVFIEDQNGASISGDLGGGGSILDVSLDITAGFQSPVVVLDCSEVTFSVISEVIEDTNCDQSEWFGAKLIRVWQAVDLAGNASNCTQEISLRAPMLSDIDLPEDELFQCGTVTSDPAMLSTDISGAPTFGCYPITTAQYDACDISITYDDVVHTICGNSYTIVRTWMITNWCSLVTLNHTQNIVVTDTEGPEIDINNIQFATGPNACATSNVFLSPAVSDVCSSVESIIATYTLGGGMYDNEGTLVISDITDGSSVTGLSFGVTQIQLNATDACGNVTEQLLDVNVTDSVDPVAICNDGLNISLSNSGTSILLATDLDEGSNDNCGIAMIEARRVDGCLGTTAWDVLIPFECCDANENITVELRVTDISGNTNVCWSTVLVEDVTSPIITCAPDATVTCDEALHAADAFGAPNAFDNCNVTIEPGEIITQDLPMCGQILTQTWTATDGADKTDDATCTQTVTVVHVSDFIVQFPADQEFENCELGDINGPIVTDDECENIGISVEDRVFIQVDDACYKIERTYTVINHCIVEDPTAGGFTALGTPLPIPNTFRDDDGFFQYTQIIKVQDTEAPTLSFTAPEACDFTDGCEGELILTATGEDDCAQFADLDFTWKIDAFSNGTFELEGTGDDATGVYPYGNHIIKWTVTDGCGNATSEEYPFSIMDCKNPTPVCQGVTTVAMNNGECVSIWALDLLEYAEDNCTERTEEEWDDNAKIRREGDNGALTTAIDICCDDLANGGVNVEVWVEDEAGNADFCIVFVEIQDNSGSCPDAGNGAAARISGTTATEFNTMVDNVEVAINTKSVMTNASGVYTSFENSYDTYVITPEKLDEVTKGISTFDLVLLAQHILQINDLTSPYQLIAADINDDKKIDVFDMLELRELILFNITSFSNNTSWRFVDREYTFQNPLAPWVENYPQSITVDLEEENKMEEDFIAVKIGDLDGSAISNLAGSLEERNFPETLTFTLDDLELKKGNEYAVDFRASDFTDITGYQFTLDFDNIALEFTSVDAGALDIDRSNFGFAMLKEGIITTSFAEMGDALNILDDEVLFTLNFTAKSNVSLEDVLSISDKYTVAEAYNVENEVSGIALTFQHADLISTPSIAFELFQNTPNPFNESTKIGFNLPEATNATIVVYDLTGKMVLSISDQFNRGYNEIVLDRNTLQATGTLFYQFKSAKYNAERKMIIID